MQFSLRPALDCDRSFVRETHLTTTREVGAKQFGWNAEQAERNASDLQLDLPNSKIVVVEGADRGYITVVMRSESEMHIDSIFLLPEVQGRGIGSAIIGELIERSRSMNLALSICTIKANERARRLYERLGFLVVWQDKNRVCMVLQPTAATA